MMKSIIHHKIDTKNSIAKSSTRTAEVLGFKVAFFNHGELISLFEEIFIFQVYKLSTPTISPYIIDCGSNIGLSVLYFKKIFPSARILAFEPDLEIFKILEQNIKQNKLTNISLHNFALNNTEGEVAFYKNSVLPRSLNMSIIKSSHVDQSAIVYSKKLSSYISKKIDMIKIDVEGIESKIINDLIESDTINLVSNMAIEFHHQLSEISLDEFIAKIKIHGFRCNTPKNRIYPNAKDSMVYCTNNHLPMHHSKLAKN